MTTRNELEALFSGQFMTPDIDECDYWEVETDQGTSYVPVDVVGVRSDMGVGYYIDDDEASAEEREFLVALSDYTDDRPQSAELKHGWLARLSAAGYMDCTEWTAFATEQEAIDYLAEQADQE